MRADKSRSVLDVADGMVAKLAGVVDTGSCRAAEAPDLDPGVREDGGPVRPEEDDAATGRHQPPLVLDYKVKGLQVASSDSAEGSKEL